MYAKGYVMHDGTENLLIFTNNLDLHANYLVLHALRFIVKNDTQTNHRFLYNQNIVVKTSNRAGFM
jgi:hypothetical protein